MAPHSFSDPCKISPLANSLSDCSRNILACFACSLGVSALSENGTLIQYGWPPLLCLMQSVILDSNYYINSNPMTARLIDRQARSSLRLGG